MARFTQYHGLTKEAREFLKDAELVTTFKGTTGIAGEPIDFGIYKKKVKYTKYDDLEVEDEEIFAEVLQREIWSGGPMIFTCLINLQRPTEFLFQWPEEVMDRL